MTSEAEVRARAHVLLGLTWPGSECGDAHPGMLNAQCDRITVALLAHARVDHLRVLGFAEGAMHRFRIED